MSPPPPAHPSSLESPPLTETAGEQHHQQEVGEGEGHGGLLGGIRMGGVREEVKMKGVMEGVKMGERGEVRKGLGYLDGSWVHRTSRSRRVFISRLRSQITSHASVHKC